MRSGNSDSYYHYDTLGSVRNVTSSTGASQWTDTYEPFGAIRTETKNAGNAPDNVMKFAGELSDPTGLYYLRARQFDPPSGRFLGVDPVAPAQPEANPHTASYVYADDRPTTLADPTGTRSTAISAGRVAASAVTSILGPFDAFCAVTPTFAERIGTL